VLEDWDRKEEVFKFGIPLTKSEFIHNFTYFFLESVRHNLDFSIDMDEQLQEPQQLFNAALERHLFLAVVKALGLVLTDRKRFEM